VKGRQALGGDDVIADERQFTVAIVQQAASERMRLI